MTILPASVLPVWMGLVLIWTSELVVLIRSLYLTFNTCNFSSSLKYVSVVKLLLYKPCKQCWLDNTSFSSSEAERAIMFIQRDFLHLTVRYISSRYPILHMKIAVNK